LPLANGSGQSARRGLAPPRSVPCPAHCEVAALLAAATETALASSLERIDVNSIETASYQPPTVRRRTFERELR
jgi:hypothetical protein